MLSYKTTSSFDSSNYNNNNYADDISVSETLVYNGLGE